MGDTEAEAILKAKQELGSDALVNCVKAIRPKGLGKLFKKTVYEVTASLDEHPEKPEPSRKESMRALFKDNPNIIFEDEEQPQSRNPMADAAALELKLNNLQSMIEKKLGGDSSQQVSAATSEVPEIKAPDTDADKNVSCIRLVYNQLVENEVDEKYVNLIVSEIEPKKPS